MIDALIDTLKVVGLVGVAIVMLAVVPFVISAMVDATDAADERIDEDYWMARGYEPLEESSIHRVTQSDTEKGGQDD